MALSVVLTCFLLCLLISATTAFNITKILDQYSDYSVFNQQLSQTRVAQEVNRRQSITILAVSNGAMSAITNQSKDSLPIIMRIHVILDYYDVAKIKKLKKEETILTTLYQTTGSANSQQGFLKVTKDNNDIKLGSAVSGAQLDARLNKAVTAIPFDISVLEISSPIVPPGLEDSSLPPTSSAPSPSKDSSPASSPSEAPADAPSDDPMSDAPAPSDADSPSDDDADADASSPAPSEEDERTADEDDSTSSSPRNIMVSGAMLLALLAATL